MRHVPHTRHDARWAVNSTTQGECYVAKKVGKYLEDIENKKDEGDRASGTMHSIGVQKLNVAIRENPCSADEYIY